MQSYLPILQYDATLSGHDDNQKLKGDILNFNLRPCSAFRTKGAFYLRFKPCTKFIIRAIIYEEIYYSRGTEIAYHAKTQKIAPERHTAEFLYMECLNIGLHETTV